MKFFFLFLTLAFFVYFSSKGQCPSKLEVWKNITTPLDPKLFGNNIELNSLQKKLLNWNENWTACGYKKDSIFGVLQQRQGVVAAWNRKNKEAIKWYNSALKHLSIKGNNTTVSSLPKTTCLLGECYLLNNDFEKAESIFKEIIRIDIPTSTIQWKVRAYLQLSYINNGYGDYHKSLFFQEKAIKISVANKDTSLLISIFFEKSFSFRKLGMYLAAINSIKQSNFYAYKKKSSLNIARNLEAIGTIYLESNQLDSALYYFHKSITVSEASKTPIQTNVLTNIGVAYYDSKNYAKALSYFTSSLTSEKDPYQQTRIIDNIARVYWKQRRYSEAFKFYEKGINNLPILKNKTLTSVLIRQSPRKEYLLSLINNKADTWLDYYKTTNTKSHLTNALKTYALADSMIDFMRYEHVGEGSKLFWRQKTRGMYERAIEASYLAGDTEAAFRFFEKSKAVLLSDKLNELGANQQLTESSAKRQRTLRDSIANLQNQLASLPANDAKRSSIQRRLEQFNDDFEAFRKQLESTNPAYYRYKYDNSTPTIAEFQKSISTNGSGARTAGFVSYFVGDSAIYAFCLDQKARLVRLSLRPSDYQSLANEFLSLCADRSRLNAHYPQYRALAHRLYQLLWKPLGMTASRVIISQDGVFLPFETLLVQPNQNDFLLKHHAISYTYSANFLAKNQTDLAPSLRQGDKLFHRSFVGFAPETFQPSLHQASLKGSVAALEAVEEKFWWGKTLKNNEATKAQFMRYAPNSRVIQLFTHADADSTEAVEPRIYFHDAALRLSELTQADRFAAQLLVLSACKTGVGQNQRGEGVFSLARGFAALGIPSTITTLWSVEDQPTYKLTKLFYHYLDQGLPKDEALQRAKLDWLNQGDAADALPSQWAGMILVGDTTPLTMDGLQFIVLGLLGLGILGGVWWWRRKK